MQFTCSAAKLIEGLQIATKALATRTPNPILEGVLVETDEDTVILTCSDERITIETTNTEATEEFDEEILHMRQLLKTKLVDMDLSVRALNCLKSAEVETLGELVVFNKTDLLKFRNFVKKSLTELDELLANLNLSFGMDISKYKLDKE